MSQFCRKDKSERQNTVYFDHVVSLTKMVNTSRGR